MGDTPHGYDPLIDHFFKALTHLQFDQAVPILANLRAAIPQCPDYAAWATYLEGVLAQEQDRDWAKAEHLFGQVLATQPPAQLCGDLYLSLSIAYENQARWPEAIAVAEKGVAIWQSLKLPIKKTMLLRQIAIAYYRGFEAGDFGREVLPLASANCEAALAILDELADQPAEQWASPYVLDPVRYRALTYQVLGCVYTCLGHYPAAATSYHHFLAISLQRQDHFHIGCASWYLADVLQLSEVSAWAKAQHLYDDALAIFEEKQEVFFQAHLLASKGSLYRRQGMPQAAMACYQQAMARLETIRARLASVEARQGFFSTVVNIHDNAVLAEWAAGNVAAAWENAERARSRIILDQLIGPLSSIAIPTALTVPQVQAALGEDDLVLEFHCTGLLRPGQGRHAEQQAANNVLYPEPKILLFALTRTALHFFEAKISPNTLFSSGADHAADTPFAAPSIRRALYQALLAPVEALLHGKRRLYLIPHGPLHAIPFQALVAPDGETLLREEGPELVYAPSATILFRELRSPRVPVTGSCLAVGYNGEPGGELGQELHFAEEEAAYIARMANGAALVGSSAKKVALYAQAPHFHALHFSCHGEFDPDAPLESLLHIGPGETLTGQEIMDNLHLNCQLVTLSACESGLSKVQRGDELYGLIRAFMYAGAPAIIATLWQVDERSTLILAEKFYSLIQQRVPYAAALKAAQLYLRNLTRTEAMQVLARHLAQRGGVDHPLLLQQADHYLKGLKSVPALAVPAVVGHECPESSAAHPPGYLDSDEKMFADPKFWAAFVLIGDPELQRRPGDFAQVGSR